MNKKYQKPIASESQITIISELLDASASDIGIDYGGVGNDEDDPTSKERYKSDGGWGNLW